MSRLAKITDCVRTYSTEFGQDQIAGIAARHGLKVMQGLWLSGHADKNREQIETAVALANRYPDAVRAVVVGNEVLLRGEMSSDDLAATIRAVKARVPVPVTYADVWEFWLRNREVAAAVDFVTIHILPYWEDFPIPARNAAAHVDSIRRQRGGRLSRQGSDHRRGRLAERRAHARGRAAVAGQPGARDPGRAGARQARQFPRQRDRGVRPAVEARARRHRRRPLGPARRRQRATPKFVWGEAVSNHPHWRLAGGGRNFIRR